LSLPAQPAKGTQLATIPVPACVDREYPHWTAELVWQQRFGCVYRLTAPDARVQFLKLSSGPRGPALEREAQRLRWAGSYLAVPEVVASGREGGVDWLITSGLPGRDGVSPELLAKPEALVAALARGLRRFHDALPVAACPFDLRLDAALEQVRRRADEGLIVPEEDFEYEFAGMSLETALSRVHDGRPSEQDFVVCHGDYCFPNVLIADGEVVAYLDLGELGVADRWYDLAAATWSTVWNVGPGYEELFLRTYGVAPDLERIAYYRLLRSLVS
jgi:kanamycin kinase